MNLKDAVATLVEFVSEWNFEDRGYDYSECPSCGWNTRQHRTNEVGLGHHAGCKLKEALGVADAFVMGQATSPDKEEP